VQLTDSDEQVRASSAEHLAGDARDTDAINPSLKILPDSIAHRVLGVPR
jgi:hypothetical protein